MYLFSGVLFIAFISSCGNKAAKTESVADSDSVITDTASIDTVSTQTTQQISADSAALSK